MRSDTRMICRVLDVVWYDLGVTKAKVSVLYTWSSIILVLYRVTAILWKWDFANSPPPESAKRKYEKTYLHFVGGFEKLPLSKIDICVV